MQPDVTHEVTNEHAIDQRLMLQRYHLGWVHTGTRLLNTLLTLGGTEEIKQLKIYIDILSYNITYLIFVNLQYLTSWESQVTQYSLIQFNLNQKNILWVCYKYYKLKIPNPIEVHLLTTMQYWNIVVEKDILYISTSTKNIYPAASTFSWFLLEQLLKKMLTN